MEVLSDRQLVNFALMGIRCDSIQDIELVEVKCGNFCVSKCFLRFPIWQTDNSYLEFDMKYHSKMQDIFPGRGGRGRSRMPQSIFMGNKS